jgi:hypothetical protein
MTVRDASGAAFLHCSNANEKAPAKGAMVFRAASLYWCRWNTRFEAAKARALRKNHAGGNMRKLILAAA